MTAARRPVAEDMPGLIDEIGEGSSLRKACEGRGIHPGHAIAYLQSDDRLWAQYMRARAIRGDEHGVRVAELAEEIIAKKVAPDVGRAAMQGLMWSASRMNRKLWGDKLEHSGPDGGPIQYAHLTPEERKARIAQLQEKALGADDGGGD